MEAMAAALSLGDELARLAAKSSRTIVGLMSGTSVDGIDAAVVEVRGSGTRAAVEVLSFSCLEFEEDLRRRLFGLFEEDALVDEVCRLNVAVGEAFAAGALLAIEVAGLAPEQVDLIGSHGQTIRHLPGGTESSTLQIGDPALIARRTGVTTVADFRAADMAVGGQGAPLVPLVDHLLFASGSAGRVMLNLGGIANVTVLPSAAGAEAVEAFDLGPANVLIDAAVAHATAGAETFDRDGRRAATGRVDEDLVGRLMRHEFLQRDPPKSTGREEFGRVLLHRAVTESGLDGDDLVATMASFSVAAVADGIRRHVQSRHRVGEVWVSGGGAHNPFIMDGLRRELADLAVGRLDDLGVSVDAKEAVAFAVLANETLMGNAGNLPAATGADAPAVLGMICPGVTST